jgi:hypothetical protein
MSGREFSLNLPFRAIKVLDIGYISAIYYITALYISVYIDSLYGTFTPAIESKKSTARLIAETVGQIFIMMTVFYIMRNVVEYIPSPFHGIAGHDHYRLKELAGATMFIIMFMFYQRNFKTRAEYIYSRISPL